MQDSTWGPKASSCLRASMAIASSSTGLGCTPSWAKPYSLQQDRRCLSAMVRDAGQSLMTCTASH